MVRSDLFPEIILDFRGDAFKAQDETDESNNIVAVSDYMVNPPILDFSFQSFALNKSSVAINDVVVPVYTVMNNSGVSTFAGKRLHQLLFEHRTIV